MNRRLIMMVLVAVVTAALATGGVAMAGSEDDLEGPDVPITGTALEQASAAALAHTGEGRVTGTEVGDEEGFYEIEITLDSGRQVDVHLDESFGYLSEEGEGQPDDA